MERMALSQLAVMLQAVVDGLGIESGIESRKSKVESRESRVESRKSRVGGAKVEFMSQQPRSPFSVPGMAGAAQFVQAMNRRPSVAARIAILVFLAVIALPVLVLIVTAGLLALAVYLVLSLWAKLVEALGGSRSVGPPPRPGEDDDGRRNVRIKS